MLPASEPTLAASATAARRKQAREIPAKPIRGAQPSVKIGCSIRSRLQPWVQTSHHRYESTEVDVAMVTQTSQAFFVALILLVCVLSSWLQAIDNPYQSTELQKTGWPPNAQAAAHHQVKVLEQMVALPRTSRFCPFQQTCAPTSNLQRWSRSGYARRTTWPGWNLDTGPV